MPVQTLCPHCKGPCLVREQFFGTPVACGRCGRSFIVPPMAEPLTEAETEAPLRTPRLDIGSATSPGRVRDRNEDTFLVQHLSWSHLDQLHDVALLVVADGMGGHESGEEASGLVIGTIGHALAPLLSGAMARSLSDQAAPAENAPQTVSLLTSMRSLLRGLGGQSNRDQAPPDTSPTALTTAITNALMEANRAIFQKAQAVPACKGMGATAAVALVWDGQVSVVHVGDCRVYHQRAAQLTQVTRDQTLVARMIELGQLTPGQAAAHAARNEVTQAVGRRSVLEPARHELTLSPGDWLIMACDGLHAHVEAPMLRETIGKAAGSVGQLAQQLVELANQQGGSDNCTIVAARCY